MSIKIVKKRIDESLFFNSLKIIKKKPKNIIFILFFDILFFLILIILGRLIRTYLPQNPAEINNLLLNLGISATVLIMILLLYNIFLILIYSVLKLAILKIIASYDKKELRFNRLGKFFLLNAIIFLISIILFLIVSSIFYYIFTPAFFKVIIAVFLVIYLILFYVFINLNHSFFISEKSLKKILKKSYLIAFKGIKKYYGALSWILVLIIAYLLFFYILGNIARAANMKQEIYNIIYAVVSFILFYSAIFINRIYFYSIAKKC